MCRCSSAFGIARSSSGRRSRAMRSKTGSMAKGWPSLRGDDMRGRVETAAPRSLLLAARNLALDALDEEVDAAEELVVGVGAGGEHLLAVVARDRALPDHEGAGFQARLHGLDLGLDVGRHLVGDRDDVDRAFLDAPPGVAAALPGSVECILDRVDVVRR